MFINSRNKLMKNFNFKGTNIDDQIKEFLNFKYPKRKYKKKPIYFKENHLNKENLIKKMMNHLSQN